MITNNTTIFSPKRRQGSSEMWWIIIGATIAIIVLVLLIVWFKDSGSKGFGVIDANIDGTNDCDKDSVADLFDKCVCIAGSAENNQAEGCPEATPATKKDASGKSKPECCIN